MFNDTRKNKRKHKTTNSELCIQNAAYTQQLYTRINDKIKRAQTHGNIDFEKDSQFMM